MNERCEVNTARFATSPDDPRYKPCDKPAHFHIHDTWMCAEHYDEYERGFAVLYHGDNGPEFYDPGDSEL